MDKTIEVLPQILDLLPENGFVLDVGSTKSNIIESVKNHTGRRKFVPSHPMSGTENSGPAAAFPELFQNRVAIICEAEQSETWAVEATKKIYEGLGANVLYMDAGSHDEHVGYVSHLSHVISYALAVAVLEKEKSTSTIFDLAAGGFASTARLAKSSADMWVPIFNQNAQNILPILDVYMEELIRFKKYLDQNDLEGLRSFIDETYKIRKVLDRRN